MKFSFNNILVPVDFSINTDVAVAKALALTDTAGATIHLLHVRKSTFYPLGKDSIDNEATQMERWRSVLQGYQPGLSVRLWVDSAASIEACIIHHATMLACDLVVIGKSKKNHWLRFFDTITPTRIAGQTGIPVLTARPGALRTKVRTIVVPITEVVPLSKMAALSLLCTRLHPTIHLVAFASNATVDNQSVATLLHVYQWVRGHLHCPVEYALLEGFNRSKALLSYAEKVDADLLLVYPEQETRLDIWNRHISDVLPPESKVQVLAVQPETEFSTI